jgi:2-polyprenyl-6-hydroxyphenyl methylase/3-demethylubiquinone-9 3-methyltransferase
MEREVIRFPHSARAPCGLHLDGLTIGGRAAPYSTIAREPPRRKKQMTSEVGLGSRSTVDPDEVARFSALASEWWDPRGRMGMLHKFNPVRLGFIKETACRHFDSDGKAIDALAGLRILDVGCGGGLLSEPLARLGAQVVGADASQPNIAAARLHASNQGLAIDYRATTAEMLADAGERFDIVLAMEVVEHVADLDLFVKRCAEMVKPGGLMIVATLNRTLKSFMLAIVGAEYVLRWLPRGTHQWDKFVTPDELENALERHGLSVIDETGVIYNLLADRWQIATDMDVNYVMVAKRERPPVDASATL